MPGGNEEERTVALTWTELREANKTDNLEIYSIDRGSALEGDASDAGLAAEVAAAVAAGEESLAQASAAQEGSAEQAVEPAAEPVDSAPQEEEQEIQLRQPKVEVTAKADPLPEPAGPAGPELTEVVGNELTGYLTGSTSLQQPAQT